MSQTPDTNSDGHKSNTLPLFNQRGLYAIAVVAILCAVGHGFLPNSFDDKTAMFLAVAVVALVIQQNLEIQGIRHRV